MYKGIHNALIQKSIIAKEYMRKNFTIFDLISRAELLVTVHGVLLLNDELSDDKKYSTSNIKWVLHVSKPFTSMTSLTHEVLMLIVAGVEDNLYQMEVCTGHRDKV